MTTAGIQGIALIAMYVAMVLISWGTTQQLTAVTVTGGVLLAVGALSLTVLRFASPDEEES